MSASSDSDDELTFIPGVQLREVAWGTLTTTGVANYVDLDTVYTLSETYSIQSVYKQTGSQMTEAAMNVSAYATVIGKDVEDDEFEKQFKGYFEIILTLESVLLESYHKSITHLQAAD